jgi:sterol desaturase/sphingolipid hydroxylase (fatty acid hydroxylase superfamily)
MSPNYILLAVPFFFLLMGIEWYLGYRKNKQLYRLNDSINNLVIGIGSQVFNVAFKVLLLGMYVLLYDYIAIFKIPATWWSFLLALVLFDFLFYWAHRWGHEMNIFLGRTFGASSE